MAARRKLVDGINEKEDRRKEEAFVYGPDKPKTKTLRAASRKAEPKAEPEPERAPLATAAANLTPSTDRIPLTTRIRFDLGTALKRASLERQLAGETPNTVQDILEQALESWLKAHGCLKD